MSMQSRRHHQRGLTLIELMIVVVLIAVAMALVAPSFRQTVDRQRVSSTNAQLVTDMQFARSEAAARNALVRVTFASNANMTCYSIYTFNPNIDNALSRCDCTLSPACSATDSIEIRRVEVPSDIRVKVTTPSNRPDEFAFEPVTGALYKVPSDREWDPLNRFRIDTSIDTQLALRTFIAISGRPTVCAPPGSKMQAAAC